MSQPAARPAPVALKKKKKFFSWDDVELTLLALPTTVWYILFSYIPLFGLLLAFKRYTIIPGENFFTNLMQSPWVGFENFKFLFLSPDAAIMLRNTVLYNVVFIVGGIILNTSLSIMISQIHSKKLQKVYQTGMFLPHFISWVVASYFIYAFFSQDKGLINSIMVSLGKERVNWYGAEGIAYWPGLLIFFHFWKGIGYNMVVYLATLTGIDGTYYEAAIIDGAGKWQQTWYVTLPMLRPVITILTILAVGRLFNSDFGLFYQGTRNSGALNDVRMTIDVYVYQALRERPNLNFAAAASAFQSIIGFCMIFSSNLLVRKIDPDSSLF